MGVARAQTAFVEEQVKQEVQAAVEATLAVRHSPTAPRARRAASPRCAPRNRRQRLSPVLRAQNAVYAHQSVPQWTSDIIEGSMKKLTGLQKPFKYIGAPAPRPANRRCCLRREFLRSPIRAARLRLRSCPQ